MKNAQESLTDLRQDFPRQFFWQKLENPCFGALLSRGGVMFSDYLDKELLTVFEVMQMNKKKIAWNFGGGPENFWA